VPGRVGGVQFLLGASAEAPETGGTITAHGEIPWEGKEDHAREPTSS